MPKSEEILVRQLDREKYLTISQACERYSFTQNQLREAISKGKINYKILIGVREDEGLGEVFLPASQLKKLNKEENLQPDFGYELSSEGSFIYPILPKPDKETNLLLVEGWKKGDINSLEKLILLNSGLVMSCAKNYPSQMQDMASEGFIALRRAALTYEKEKGSFAVYCLQAIRRRLKRAYEKNKEEAHAGWNPAIPISPIMPYPALKSPDPKQEAINKEQKEIITKALSSLDKRERFVIKWHYGIDYRRPRTLKELGRKMNVSQERARQLEKQAFEKIMPIVRRAV